MSPAQTLKVLAVAVAVVVAIVAGGLAWIGGSNPANAVLRGGTAFAGALALMIAVMTATGVL
jgi:hypothetical protein